MSLYVWSIELEDGGVGDLLDRHIWDDYPELGIHRLEDEAVRNQTGDDIIEVQERLQDVIEWRKKLERIEDG